MKTSTCPVCSGGITKGPSGYYTCSSHGVMPYGYVAGEFGRDRALDMMADWGMAERPRKRRAVEPSTEEPRPGVAELLKQLKGMTNPADKRRLRAKLRALGHKGGARG